MNLQHRLSRRPHKADVLEIVSYIGTDDQRFADLIDIILHGEPDSARYASWVVNHCMGIEPNLISPHLESLIQNLAKLPHNHSIIRSSVKALADTPEIPENLQGIVLEHCFGYLLNPKTAVAIQVHAMQTIFNIAKDEPYLLMELVSIIEENLPRGSAGYKSRGKRILGSCRKILAKHGMDS